MNILIKSIIDTAQLIVDAVYRSAGLMFLYFTLIYSLRRFINEGDYSVAKLSATLYITIITNFALFVPWMLFRAIRESKQP